MTICTNEHELIWSATIFNPFFSFHHPGIIIETDIESYFETTALPLNNGIAARIDDDEIIIID